MCGRFAISSEDAATIAEDLAREFDIVLHPDSRRQLADTYRPRFNAAPGDRHWVLTHDAKIHVGPWGLAHEQRSSRSFNARAETVHQKPSFREGFRRSRALLVCTGFYEWNTLGTREPWLFRPQGLSYFALAAFIDMRGVSTSNTSADGPRADAAFAVLTVDANDMIAPMHPRMPALLGRGASREWLDRKTPVERLQQLLRPAPVSAMSRLRVDPRVNNPAFDDPRCFDPPGQTSFF